jgi:hypothetical protein
MMQILKKDEVEKTFQFYKWFQIKQIFISNKKNSNQNNKYQIQRLTKSKGWFKKLEGLMWESRGEKKEKSLVVHWQHALPRHEGDVENFPFPP